MVLSSRLEPKPKLMIPKRRTRFAVSEKTELYLIESMYCEFISTTMRPFFKQLFSIQMTMPIWQ